MRKVRLKAALALPVAWAWLPRCRRRVPRPRTAARRASPLLGSSAASPSSKASVITTILLQERDEPIVESQLDIVAATAPRRHCSGAPPAPVVGGQPTPRGVEGDESAVRLPPTARPPMPGLLARRGERGGAERQERRRAAEAGGGQWHVRPGRSGRRRAAAAVAHGEIGACRHGTAGQSLAGANTSGHGIDARRAPASWLPALIASRHRTAETKAGAPPRRPTPRGPIRL